MHNSSAAARHPAPPAFDFERELALLLPDLRRRARFVTGSAPAADDLVQDTVERALRFRQTFVVGSNLRAWAMRILANTFISTQRRQTVERRVLEQAAHDPNGWANTGPSCIKLGLTRTVLRELDRLPPRIGAALRLVDLEESSYREAADELDVPVGTIMSRLHRGRTRLAVALGGGLTQDALARVQPAPSAA